MWRLSGGAALTLRLQWLSLLRIVQAFPGFSRILGVTYFVSLRQIRQAHLSSWTVSVCAHFDSLIWWTRGVDVILWQKSDEDVPSNAVYTWKHSVYGQVIYPAFSMGFHRYYKRDKKQSRNRSRFLYMWFKLNLQTQVYANCVLFRDPGVLFYDSSPVTVLTAFIDFQICKCLV